MRPFKRSRTSKKSRDRRGKHTKAERLAKLRAIKNGFTVHKCRGCDSILDPAIRTEEGDAIVCTQCGLVDNNTCFDLESPIFDYVQRSPDYVRKNYFAERIRQARNIEPRLTEHELHCMSVS